MVEGPNAKAAGRLAGLAYLTIIAFSTFGYLTLTRILGVPREEGTARLAVDHTLFDLALASSVIGLAAWVAVGLLIYGLTKPAGRVAGLAMLAFVAAGTAANLAALAQLLPVVRWPEAGLDADTLAPMVARYNRILLLSQVFSGLWLFPFGWLVVRSRIAPRLIGLCLMLGGFGYLSVFATAFVPSLDRIAAYRLVGSALGIAVLIGEAGICLWLLIMGAREPSSPKPLPQWSAAKAGPKTAAPAPSSKA